MAIVGTYGGTAGQISFDSTDGNVKVMSIPDGATSVTLKNTSSSTQFVFVWIPGIHRTTDGQSPTDIAYAQWAYLFGSVLGVTSGQTFTLRPNGIKEVYVKTTASSFAPATLSFGVSGRSITDNFSSRRDCR